MNLKIIYTFLALSCLFSIQSFAQPEEAARGEHEVSVQQKLDQYFDFMIRSEWDSLMDMIYPKLFSLAPRELMIETFKQISSQEMKITFDLPEIQSISAPVDYEEEVFSKVDYLVLMNMQMLFEDLQAPEFIEFLQTSFQQKYGPDNVKYDPSSFTFALKIDSEMFAIAPTGTTDWKFIENKDDQVDLINQLIPQNIREELDK